jgi:hypothetical protein
MRYYLQATREAIQVFGWQRIIRDSKKFGQMAPDDFISQHKLDTGTGLEGEKEYRDTVDGKGFRFWFRDHQGRRVVAWAVDREEIDAYLLPLFTSEGEIVES